MPRSSFCWPLMLVAALFLAPDKGAAEAGLQAALPADLGLDADRLNQIDSAIQQALEKSQLPGAVVLVVHRGKIVFRKAYGQRSREPVEIVMTVDTVFDLASLTKPIATATSIFLLMEQGKLRLTDRLADYLPAFRRQETGAITLEHLLLHTSGFIADNPLKDYQEGVARAWERLEKLSPEAEPGSRFRYSDVNFILLGKLVEKVSGETLDAFARKHLFEPLGLRETAFKPQGKLAERAAPTEKRNGRWMQGEVHDPRAFLLGGVAGHAGLFSTADDLAVFAQMLLNQGSFEGRRILSPATVKLLTTPRPVPGGQRALGWDAQTSFSSNRGELFPIGGFGHTGFTGTSLWVDPASQTAVIFLSNRVHPHGKGNVTKLRSQVATLVAGSIQGLQADPPPVQREFRGAWIATVANIDWPSKKGLTSEQQKAELRAMLDRAAKMGLNAVVFQVRPMADALFSSKLEPWSEFLTGKAGQAPSPLYDPLEFAVAEAHARGLELHAWFNPYRARSPAATSPLSADHLVNKRPDLAKLYGKHHWLNPTHPEVQDHSLKVILDVVRRYDIDGVHLDDYFYPYPEKDADGKIIPFPDDDTWTAYQKDGGKLSRDDWRREAVNRFVERLYREVKEAKPWVKVGISPFGIWRPGNPPGITGFDQYGELFADARLWLQEGWVDYFSPQLYWPIAQEKQSYPRLLEWWVNQNEKGRHLWPGNYTSKITGTDKGWPAKEIVDQIEVTRGQKGATGNIHFSMKPLVHNTGGIADALTKLYAEPALVPAVPWAAGKPPAPPPLRWDRPDLLHLQSAEKEPIRGFVVQSFQGGNWKVRMVPCLEKQTASLSFNEVPERIAVSSVDRFGQVSTWATWKK